MKFWRSIINYFIQGLLFLVPLSVTIFTIYYVFHYLDALTTPYVIEYIGYEIPGFGLLLVFVFIILIGFLGSTIVFNPLISFLERLINRAPLIKDIYSSIKDLLSAFVGNKKKFNNPVIVKMNNSGLKRIGFVTRNGMESMNISNTEVAVYLPYSYGVMGTIIIVPKENVESIEQSSTDVMKFIVSGGVTEVEDIPKNKKDKKT
jgi:uncharacterized membrane protein